MVKRFLTIALAVMLAGTVAAQRVQLGVRGGVFSQDMELKLSDIAGMDNIQTDARMGFHAAVVARVRLTAVGSGAIGLGLYLQPEVIYSQNTYKIQTSGGSTPAKIKMQSVDIPVLLSFKVSIIRVQAGPVFNVMQKSPSNRSEIDLMTMKPTVGYSLGASVDIWGGLVLDGRFNGQFKELKNNLRTENEGVYESVKGSLSSWSLGLAWLF